MSALSRLEQTLKEMISKHLRDQHYEFVTKIGDLYNDILKQLNTVQDNISNIVANTVPVPHTDTTQLQAMLQTQGQQIQTMNNTVTSILVLLQQQNDPLLTTIPMHDPSIGMVNNQNRRRNTITNPATVPKPQQQPNPVQSRVV
jgi:hypothetical protein